MAKYKRQSKKSKSTKELTREVLKMKKQMNRTKAEFKRSVHIINTANPLNTGIVTSLVGIAQGTDILNRIGEKIRVRRVNLCWRAELGVGGLNQQILRVMVVKDFGRTGGVIPTYNTIMYQNQPETVKDLTRWNRFQIIYDKSVILSTTNNPNSNVYKAVLYPKLECLYSGTTATSQESRDLYLVLCSSQTGANGPSVTGSVMVHYYDS